MKVEGKFTEKLWEAIHPIFLNLINHPFVKDLSDGSLDYKRFSHYLAQDILYIKDDSIALKNLSIKANKSSQRAFFLALANDGIKLENMLHNHFLKEFNVKKASRKSPVISDYTSFLINHSLYSTYGVAAAALLPCFWVYYSIGKHIIENSVDSNPYKKWIETYEGGEYETFVQSFVKIVEDLGSSTSKQEQKIMQKVFIQATKFELAFFEESFGVV